MNCWKVNTLAAGMSIPACFVSYFYGKRSSSFTLAGNVAVLYVCVVRSAGRE